MIKYECLLGSDSLLMKGIIIKVASTDQSGRRGHRSKQIYELVFISPSIGMSYALFKQLVAIDDGLFEELLGTYIM